MAFRAGDALALCAICGAAVLGMGVQRGLQASYDDFDVDITGSRSESNGHVTVRTVIVGGRFEGAQLDYRLRDADGSWKVIDVKVEGISMVSNFREQFKEVVSDGGPELLLKKLQEKNAAPASND